MSTLPLFYAQPKVLQPRRHGARSLAGSADYRFTATTNAVPLVAAEMPSAARHFPVVFTDEALPQPVAVLGLRAGQNLFVDAQGQWQPGSYVPAYVRRYPFIFLENEACTEYTLCIDEAAVAVVPGSWNPFFDASDRPTPLTRSALAFCRDYQAQLEPTLAFARALVAAQLLVDHRADVTLKDGQQLSLSGFKVIDEAKFNGLPDAEFCRWRTRGWLPWVYAHFASVGAWSGLMDRMVAVQ
jgi:SapC